MTRTHNHLNSKGKELSAAPSGPIGCHVDAENSRNYNITRCLFEGNRTLGTNNAHRVLQAQHWTPEIETGFFPHCCGKVWNTCLDLVQNSQEVKPEQQSTKAPLWTWAERHLPVQPELMREREIEKRRKHCDKVREKGAELRNPWKQSAMCFLYTAQGTSLLVSLTHRKTLIFMKLLIFWV